MIAGTQIASQWLQPAYQWPSYHCAYQLSLDKQVPWKDLTSGIRRNWSDPSYLGGGKPVTCAKRSWLQNPQRIECERSLGDRSVQGNGLMCIALPSMWRAVQRVQTKRHTPIGHCSPLDLILVPWHVGALTLTPISTVGY